MIDQGAYKQIVTYIDGLHHDTGQLAAFVDTAMQERGWASLPTAGSTICWQVSRALDRAHEWRIPYISRFYARQNEQKTCHSIFFLVSLEAKTAFDFPAVLCGRAEHPMLSEAEILYQVFDTLRLRSLLRPRSDWVLRSQEGGWASAEPAFRKTSMTQQLVYILNLFELTSKQQVIDNIVRPLTEDAAILDLRSALTVWRYFPPDLEESV